MSAPMNVSSALNNENSDLIHQPSAQVQARFFTKQAKYSVPDTPFSIPANSSPEQLNRLINSLQSNSNNDWENVEFDFIVVGELLRLSLLEHLHIREVSTESVIDVEYIERYPAPELEENVVHDDWVSAVCSTDTWVLTGCYDNTLQLRNLVTKEHKLTIPGHLGPIKGLSWVQQGEDCGTFVSTSHDETAILWEWNQHSNSIECLVVCKGHLRSVDCVDTSTDHTKFATGSYDRTLKIWSADMESADSSEESEESSRKKLKTEKKKTRFRSPLATLSGHGEAITGVQWTDRNEILTASMDNTLRLWDLELGGLKSQLNSSKAVLGVHYSPISGLALTAAADRHVRLWDPRSNEGSIVKSVFTSHTGWVSCVRWSPTNRNLFVSGSYDTLLKLWDIRSPRASLYDMTGQEDRILCCDWSTSNHVLSGGVDNQLKIYTAKNQVCEERVF